MPDTCTNRRIRVLGFWCLKRGLRRIFSFSARVCARNVRFYKPCTSAASEKAFDLVKRILRLKVISDVIMRTHSHDHFCELLSASDRKHVNRPNIKSNLGILFFNLISPFYSMLA